MQIVVMILTVFLFFLIAEMLGTIYNNCIFKTKGNTLFNGFFLYFALFEIVALPMIMMQKHLSALRYIWGIVCIIVVICGACFALKKRNKNVEKISESIWTRHEPGLCIAIILLLVQTAIALMQPNNSWDTAFYIGNVVKAMQTDTMYLYDGYTGWKDTAINLKYAMCSFYMNDAVIGSALGIHGAIVCRWFNTLVCQFFSAYIVYQLGMELWKAKKSAYTFVCFWILANLGLSTEFFASSFLVNRSYEAKAFCANIVLPGVLLILLKITKNPIEKENWISLFIINIASVAISSSCLMLVPLLEGIMLLVMIAVKKKAGYILHSVICMIPCCFYLLLYLLNHFQIWKIMIS